jgi:hypothetical protein
MLNNRNRWPKSIHSQCEAVFHAVRSIRMKKYETEGIRSFGTWRTYKYESHRFVQYMSQKGRDNILKIKDVQDDMADYLQERLDDYAANKRSRQTFETILAALAKFEYAVNRYIEIHLPSDHPKLDTEQTRMSFYTKSKQLLKKSSRAFENRAYSDPVALIETITDGRYQLQASLQYEGGLRAEGVGAPSHKRLKNPLTEEGLRGIVNDPVTGHRVGVVAAREKGGKETEHYVSLETYKRLENYFARNGKLENDYYEYVEAINKAAQATNQYATGRGTHGLKHNFAQERYHQCVKHGMKHEEGLQQTSLETSHFRMSETLAYTRGKR